MRHFILLLIILGTFGCGSGQARSQQTTSATAPTTQHPGHQMCSTMAMAGGNVVASDTTDGVAVAFTTSGDVAALRAHVRKMAEMHNGMAGMHHDRGMGSGDTHGGMGSGDTHGGMGSGDMHGGMMRQPMVPSRASVEDIPGGARVTLVPTDPSQLSALRVQAREHATMMARGECPMMEKRPPLNKEHSQHHPAGG